MAIGGHQDRWGRLRISPASSVQSLPERQDPPPVPVQLPFGGLEQLEKPPRLDEAPIQELVNIGQVLGVSPLDLGQGLE